MTAPSKVPVGSLTIGQIKRSQGTAKCGTCGKTISGNKNYCGTCVTDKETNTAQLIDRLKRIQG